MTERKQTHVVDLGAALKRSVEAPTLAELQAVSLAAWTGLIRARTSGFVRAEDHQAAVAAGFIGQSLADGGIVDLTTPKGTRYLAALRAIREGLSEDERTALADVEGALCSPHWGALLDRELVDALIDDGGDPVPVRKPLGAALLLLEREDLSRG